MIEVANLYSTRILSKTTIERVLRRLFGYDPETVAFTWNMLHTKELIERGTDIKYLLYMCMYIKGYDTYVVLRFPQSLAVSFSPCSSEGTAQKGRIENT
jgi:hypothetical protein